MRREIGMEKRRLSIHRVGMRKDRKTLIGETNKQGTNLVSLANQRENVIGR